MISRRLLAFFDKFRRRPGSGGRPSRSSACKCMGEPWFPALKVRRYRHFGIRETNSPNHRLGRCMSRGRRRTRDDGVRGAPDGDPRGWSRHDGLQVPSVLLPAGSPRWHWAISDYSRIPCHASTQGMSAADCCGRSIRRVLVTLSHKRGYMQKEASSFKTRGRAPRTCIMQHVVSNTLLEAERGGFLGESCCRPG